MSRRGLWAIVVCDLLAGLGAAAASIWGGYPANAPIRWVTLALTLAVGWSFAGLGAVAWARWPSSRTGLLMTG
jgi:hypothetical protein